jgi:hypothetical protein
MGNCATGDREALVVHMSVSLAESIQIVGRSIRVARSEKSPTFDERVQMKSSLFSENRTSQDNFIAQ